MVAVPFESALELSAPFEELLADEALASAEELAPLTEEPKAAPEELPSLTEEPKAPAE